MNTTTTILAVATLLFLYHRWVTSRPKFPLPPGPKGFPIIGSLLDTIMDNDKRPQWIKYLDMGGKYNSNIVHINVLGGHTLILNSLKAVDERRRTELRRRVLPGTAFSSFSALVTNAGGGASAGEVTGEEPLGPPPSGLWMWKRRTWVWAAKLTRRDRRLLRRPPP